MTTHGMRNTREYKIWEQMKRRCLNPKATNFRDYGGRGITVCDEWRTFEGFFADMGLSNGLFIDRIDNNKGYCKENCHWTTATQNNRNRRNNVIVEGKTLAQWAEETGISQQVISYRINRKGMSPISAVTTPLMRRRTAASKEKRV